VSAADTGPEGDEGADSTWGLSGTPLDFLLVATLNPTWEGTVEEELMKMAHAYQGAPCSLRFEGPHDPWQVAYC